jgi:hypothetical protein
MGFLALPAPRKPGRTGRSASQRSASAIYLQLIHIVGLACASPAEASVVRWWVRALHDEVKRHPIAADYHP